MAFSPDLGYTLEPYADLDRELYEIWKAKFPTYTKSFENYRGSPEHRINELWLQKFMTLQEIVVASDSKLFNYFVDNNLHIKGSMTGSVLGIQNAFKEHSDGVTFVDRNDDPLLIAGECRVHFDNLKASEEEIKEIWHKNLAAGIFYLPKPQDDEYSDTNRKGYHRIVVDFADKSREIYYYNLDPQFYLPVEFQVNLYGQKYVVFPPVDQVRQAVIDDFDEQNYIGKHIYASLVLNNKRDIFKTMASIEITVRERGTGNYVDILKCPEGLKYFIENANDIEYNAFDWQGTRQAVY